MKKLKEGKDQKVFDERLKNNPMRVIQHAKQPDSEECYCRICGFDESGTNILAKAKRHAQKTGHTIDVYYESWREITYCKTLKQ